MENQIAKTRSGDGKTENRHSNADLQSTPIYRPRSWLLPVAVTSGVAAVGGAGFWWLLWASQTFDRASDAVTFITGGSLTLALLLVAFVQACVYWSQRRIMGAQWSVMERGLERTDKMVDKMQLQLETMRDGIKENRELFNLGERAYLGIKFTSMNNFKAGRKEFVRITIENAGNTPAWEIEARTAVGCGTKHPSRRNVIESSGRGVAHFLTAKSERSVDISIDTSGLTPEIRTAIDAGTKFIFVRGLIEFTDISKERRPLPFCLRYRDDMETISDCKDEHEEQEGKTE